MTDEVRMGPGSRVESGCWHEPFLVSRGGNVLYGSTPSVEVRLALGKLCPERENRGGSPGTTVMS